MERFGDVTLTKIEDSAELRRLLPASLTGSETVIVKPNWFSPHHANYTDAHARAGEAPEARSRHR